jgi:hypothetical protein
VYERPVLRVVCGDLADDWEGDSFCPCIPVADNGRRRLERLQPGGAYTSATDVGRMAKREMLVRQSAH